MKRIVAVILGILLLAGIIVAPVTADDTGIFHTQTCYIELGPWIWDAAYHNGAGRWMYPDGAVGKLDLRSIPQMSNNGTDIGMGLFFCTKQLGAPYRLLGTDFNTDISPANMNFIQNTFNVKLDSVTTNGTVWSMFVEHGDPTGLLRWQPLTPEVDGTLRIVINGFSPVVFAKDVPKCRQQFFKPPFTSPFKGWHWGYNWGRYGFWFFK